MASDRSKYKWDVLFSDVLQLDDGEGNVQVLSIDPDAITGLEFSTPRGITERPPREGEDPSCQYHEFNGRSSLVLKIEFGPGNEPRWTKKPEEEEKEQNNG